MCHWFSEHVRLQKVTLGSRQRDRVAKSGGLDGFCCFHRGDGSHMRCLLNLYGVFLHLHRGLHPAVHIAVRAFSFLRPDPIGVRSDFFGCGVRVRHFRRVLWCVVFHGSRFDFVVLSGLPATIGVVCRSASAKPHRIHENPARQCDEAVTNIQACCPKRRESQQERNSLARSRYIVGIHRKTL